MQIGVRAGRLAACESQLRGMGWDSPLLRNKLGSWALSTYLPLPFPQRGGSLALQVWCGEVCGEVCDGLMA